MYSDSETEEEGDREDPVMESEEEYVSSDPDPDPDTEYSENEDLSDNENASESDSGFQSSDTSSFTETPLSSFQLACDGHSLTSRRSGKRGARGKKVHFSTDTKTKQINSMNSEGNQRWQSTIPRSVEMTHQIAREHTDNVCKENPFINQPVLDTRHPVIQHEDFLTESTARILFPSFIPDHHPMVMGAHHACCICKQACVLGSDQIKLKASQLLGGFLVCHPRCTDVCDSTF